MDLDGGRRCSCSGGAGPAARRPSASSAAHRSPCSPSPRSSATSSSRRPRSATRRRPGAPGPRRRFEAAGRRPHPGEGRAAAAHPTIGISDGDDRGPRQLHRRNRHPPRGLRRLRAVGQRPAAGPLRRRQRRRARGAPVDHLGALGRRPRTSASRATALASIIDGSHDAYIDMFAKSILKQFGHPVTIRLMHEMNGNWYPWGLGVNGNRPGQYVAAWQHVHDRFTALGVTDVSWMWAPNAVYTGSAPLAPLYPGDAYVDAVGLSNYNWGHYSHDGFAHRVDDLRRPLRPEHHPGRSHHEPPAVGRRDRQLGQGRRQGRLGRRHPGRGVRPDRRRRPGLVRPGGRRRGRRLADRDRPGRRRRVAHRRRTGRRPDLSGRCGSPAPASRRTPARPPGPRDRRRTRR